MLLSLTAENYINCIKATSKLKKSFKTRGIAVSTLPSIEQEGTRMIKTSDIRERRARSTS